MFRKRNRLENQPLEKLNQKGASVIILALIIMVFMSITILGITKLTISEKKRAKSTSVSAEAYQKADEAMECALWGRNRIIEVCSDKTIIDSSSIYYNLYFPQDITGEYCSDYDGKVKPHHLVTDPDTGNNIMEKITTCASPFYISLFTSKGTVKIEEGDNAFTGKMTKQRGIGATVHTSDGDSESSLFKPYVCCNKIAIKGDIDATIEARCNSMGTIEHPSVLDNDNGLGDHGWLENNYWEPCANICLEDDCAYYNTELDPYDVDDLPVNNDDSLYDFNDDRKEGAHWCWTNEIGFGDLGTEGHLYNCMSIHIDADTDDAKYWNHPDVAGFCSVCNRLDIDGTDERTGNICGEMAINVGNVNPAVWGDLGDPNNSICQGALGVNNCYSCNCVTFEAANSEICNACTQTGEVYDCATP